MSRILNVKNVSDYNRYIGQTDLHPLVSVIDYSEVSPIRSSLNNYSVYGIFFHNEEDIDLEYGRGRYDYRKRTVICVAPGQIGGKEDDGKKVMLTGWALLFHPDILEGTALGKKIKEYTFFDYSINEALEMTDEEYGILSSLMRLLQKELSVRSYDELQRDIITGYIGVVLDYCQRFYDRQFSSGKPESHDILARFEDLLRDYYEKGTQMTEGIPSVHYCAERLCMSPGYFGETVKKATGDTASNYIRRYIIRLARNRMAAGSNITQTAYDLGFDYPQHLSRMFRKLCGCTPTEYINNLNK